MVVIVPPRFLRSRLGARERAKEKRVPEGFARERRGENAYSAAAQRERGEQTNEPPLLARGPFSKIVLPVREVPGEVPGEVRAAFSLTCEGFGVDD